ncbi:MAG: Na(+)-translocating NADH-quinone reductase subunit A [Flavobacteriales bacterium]|jgi:Na+-transporting NADH:ubiquinone oxidoreductase subunit A|nr:Na(+)-translocating NADH-quinone reductase subunit A [Flavobacteriales bacterium]
MSREIRIKKGVDIPMIGKAELKMEEAPRSSVYSIRPDDFHGVTPKLHLKAGAKVNVGTPIFYDKNVPDVNFVSPVSGEIQEIVRGAKRKIMEIVIKADAEDQFEDLGTINIETSSREDILNYLLKSGVWPMIKQLPYAVIADPAFVPKNINISAFNSAPLAADESFMVEGESEAFQMGLNVLAKLTSGKVHLNLKGKGNNSTVFTNAQGVVKNTFSGPHPAGNNGVQINKLDPINKGETVWYTNPQGVVAIGKTMMNGKYDATKILALCGEEIKEPKYYRAIQGAQVKDILGNQVKGDNVRLISGDVLTGLKLEGESAINFYGHELTVIPEGNHHEFMGWTTPNPKKYSLSRTYLSWLMPGKKFSFHTNLQGEERAFVVSGEYEKYFPIDVYPVQLIKAALARDIEVMEGLGIYEVTPEDFALAEFACTSKIEVQEIIRQALDLVKKELS